MVVSLLLVGTRYYLPLPNGSSDQLLPTPAKPANPFGLKSIASVVYPQNGRRQTQLSYLYYFQRISLEKWPFFSKNDCFDIPVLSEAIDAHFVGAQPGRWADEGLLRQGSRAESSPRTELVRYLKSVFCQERSWRAEERKLIRYRIGGNSPRHAITGFDYRAPQWRDGRVPGCLTGVRRSVSMSIA